jgi:hypothetical protein
LRACPCGASVADGRIGFRDVCDACQAWLHSCRNCDFYAPGASKDCREPAAELVADKQGGNFCDFFRWERAGERNGAAAPDARGALDALFRKGAQKR